MISNSSSRAKRERQGSLTSKIRWTFVPFVVVSLIVVGAMLTYLSYRAQQQALSRNQRQAAESVGLFISSYLRSSVRELLLFEQTQDLATLDLQEQQAALGSILDYRRDVLDEIALLDSAGNEVVKVSEYRTYMPADLTNHANTPLFRTTSRGGSFIGSVYLSQYSLPNVQIAVPVHDERSQVVGALLAEVSIRQMWEAVAGVELGETGYAYIVDQDGTLLAHKTLAIFFAHRFEDLSTVPEVREALTEGQTTAPDVYQDFTGERVTSAHAPIQVENIQWVAVVATPVNEAYTNIYNMLIYLGGILAGALILAGVVGTLLPRAIVRPLSLLEEGASIIGRGDLDHQIEVKTRDEIGRLAKAFNNMATQLRGLVGSLEQRVADRTHELEQRSTYLEAAAGVGQIAATILDPDQLVEQAVELLSKRFDLYYVGLFLVDRTGEWAVLQANAGQTDRPLPKPGERLRVGPGSMIGWSIANARARVALEVEEDAERLVRPELPDTRSEAAVPLRTRGHVIGALTVQHTEPGAFDEDAIVVMQTTADQVAVALENARLFAERQEALEAAQRAYGELGRQAWREMLRDSSALGYRSDEYGISDAGDIWRPEMEQALHTGQTVRSDGADADPDAIQPLAIPIKARGETVGVLDTYKSVRAGDWTTDEVDLLEAIADQLGEALESARLYQETRRRAVREEAIRQVTERMRRAVDVEAILQSTVAELAKALGAPRAYVRLGTEAELQAGGGPVQPTNQTADIDETEDGEA